jgi:LysM repeat protein
MFKKKRRYYPSSKARLWRQVRFLTFSLIASGAFNIVMAVLMISSYLTEPPPVTTFRYKPISLEKKYEKSISVAEQLEEYRKLSFGELCDLLNDTAYLADGYTRRDVALSTLVTFHHLNIDAVIPAEHHEARTLRLTDGEEVELYPSSNEALFSALNAYIHEESWPYTSEGMLSLLQKPGWNNDDTLKEAFYLSSEFSLIELLFRRDETPLSREEILALLIEGKWEEIHSFTEEQSYDLDISPLARIHFLETFLPHGSKRAAKLIVERDPFLAADELTNDSMMQLVSLLDERSDASEMFLFEIIMSPRSETIWQQAAQHLYTWEGEEVPEPYDHMIVVQRFIPRNILEESIVIVTEDEEENDDTAKEEEEEDKGYTVIDGDSLWKIAKKHGITTQALRDANDISNDVLKTGTVLHIPK